MVNGQETGTPSCLSLEGTTTCPEFSGYYISSQMSNYSSDGLNSSWLTEASTVQKFDSLLTNYTNNGYAKSYYVDGLNCSNFDSKSMYVRYTMTMICARLVESEPSNLCLLGKMVGNSTLIDPKINYLLGRKLCRETCYSHIASLVEITQNATICPTISTATSSRSSVVNLLNAWCSNENYTDTTQDCISGELNERQNCGKDI